MKVYVIEKGNYSDSHVVAVADSEEEAKRICGILRDSELWEYDKKSIRYTEFDTNQFQTDRIRFCVEYYLNDWRATYDDYDFYSSYKDNIEDYEDHYVIYAATPHQAIKIAQDMRAEKLAGKEGIV